MKALHTCVYLDNVEEAAKAALLMRMVGYRAVVVEKSSKYNEIADVFRDAGLNVYPRCTIRVRRAQEIPLRASEARRSGCRVVAVVPESEEAMRYSARDYRVDIIVFRPGFAKLLDSSQARLHRMGGGYVEIDLSPILSSDDFAALRSLSVAIRRAVAYNVPAIVASCVKSAWDIVAPKSLEALVTLLGVHPNHAKMLVYHAPWAMIREAVRKR